MNEQRRRNPDQILRAVQKMESLDRRGKLRVFLGMCPGVGKTYAMLRSGHEQLARGKRVKIGVVETHGRRETEELVSGIPIIPKKLLEYKGSFLSEMDLDGILEQKPDIVLIDELAHTNVPTARHQKRHQDVIEILDAGIDVYTTVNIQHIESRNDQVAQISGVVVRETVPDSLLEIADQIEVIDLPPQELLQRLKEGKVYLGERAELAAKNFFKEENLTALRELALRLTAEKVDQDLQGQMAIKGIEGPWSINERLLVAISHSPYSPRLIRAARRMAYSLEAPWIALYVDTGESLEKDDEIRLKKNIELARELGAEIVTTVDTHLAAAIQRTCEEKNVTQIIMGRPDRRFLKDLIAGGTLLDQLVRTTGKIDVHVIRAERPPRYRGWHIRVPEFKSKWLSYYYTSFFLTFVSVLSYGLMPLIGYQALGSLFLLSILVVAGFASRGPIIFAAVFSGLVWDYFFIPPKFTFAIHRQEDLMMLGSFFLVAVITGYLTSKIRTQEKILENRERRARNLYELGNRIADAKSTLDILTVLTSAVTRQLGGRAYVWLIDTDGKLPSQIPLAAPLSPNDRAVAEWVVTNKKRAGWSTQTLSGSSCLCLPLIGNSGIVGVFIFYPDPSQAFWNFEQENFVDTVVAHVAVAIERNIFIGAAQKAQLLEASEKLHKTLLNSVSHELRTPITAIIGTATALKDTKTFNDANARDGLVDELVRASHRLDRVVENLLDMSRLEQGALQLKHEWFEIDDLIKESWEELADECEGRPFVTTGDIGILVDGDFGLLKHALSNIFLNAVRYSPPRTIVEVEIIRGDRCIKICTKDRGRGLVVGDEHRLFEKFYRAPGTPSGGLGLGLSIVKSIIELHGGSVHAKNRGDGTGAEIIINIPVKTPPDDLKEIMQ